MTGLAVATQLAGVYLTSTESVWPPVVVMVIVWSKASALFSVSVTVAVWPASSIGDGEPEAVSNPSALAGTVIV